MILNQRTGSGSLPLAHPSYHTKVIRRVRPLPHKPITPSQMALLVCGLTAAPCPYLYEHRQSCPGVTQAVLYVHPLHPFHPKVVNIGRELQVLALPFSTHIADCAVPHTFVQPIDCLMSNPYPGDTNWIPGTSGWRESCAWLPPGK